MSIYRFSSDFTPSFVKMWNAEELIQVRFYAHWAEKQTILFKKVRGQGLFLDWRSFAKKHSKTILIRPSIIEICLVFFFMYWFEWLVEIFKLIQIICWNKTKVLWHFLKCLWTNYFFLIPLCICRAPPGIDQPY